MSSKQLKLNSTLNIQTNNKNLYSVTNNNWVQWNDDKNNNSQTTFGIIYNSSNVSKFKQIIQMRKIINILLPDTSRLIQISTSFDF